MILCLTVFSVSVFAAADTEVKIPASVVLKGQGSSESVTTEILLEGEGEVPASKKHSIRIKGTGKGTFHHLGFMNTEFIRTVGTIQRFSMIKGFII